VTAPEAAAAILLDGPSVIVSIATAALAPMALQVAGTGRRLPRLAIGAGLLAAISLWLPPGGAAIALVAPYAIVCALAGAIGVVRLLARPVPPSQLAVNAGLIVLAGAAVWLVSHRAGHALLGYPPLWVLLTAAHFHIAGAVLPIVVGWRIHGRGRWTGAIAIGCVAGLPMTAAGIVGSHALEVAAALLMAASAAAAACLLLATPPSEPAYRWLRIAGAPLLAGMLLAAGYALRDRGLALSIAGLDPLSSMIATHAVLDTLFAAIALAGLVRHAPRVLPAPPLSRLAGSWPVGEDFLARRGLERPELSARGLVDRLEDLAHAGLPTAGLPPAIRAFYEETGAHELVVRPRWRLGFRTGGRLWARIARRIGQLQLPVADEPAGAGLASRIVALDAAADGRAAPRAWIRTYPDGRPLYVALYATHRAGDRAYMNIAFPLPGGQLSSILRMDRHGDSDSVSVSTRLGGDCGIWLVLRIGRWRLPIRLPLSETIDVWAAGDPAAPPELRAWAAGYSTIARHDLWLFGIHYLSLEYGMRPRPY
jgi:hypothetical protein